MSIPKLSTLLVESADRLIGLHGAAGVSLRGIAREAGVTAPAIYAYFPDKQSIIDAVIAYRFEILRSALAEGAASARRRGADPFAVLVEACNTYCRIGERQPRHYALLFGADAALGTMGYEGSAGADTFGVLESLVADVLAESDGVAVTHAAVDIWSAMHGLVLLRTALVSFPWPSRSEQIERLVRRLVGGE